MWKEEEDEITDSNRPDRQDPKTAETDPISLGMLLIMAYVPVIFIVVLFNDSTLVLLLLLLVPVLAVVYLHIMAGTFWKKRCRKAAEKLDLEYFPLMGDDQRVIMAFRAFQDYLNMIKKGEQNSVYDIFYGTYHGHQLFAFNLGVSRVAGIIKLDRSFPELRIWPEKGPSGYMGRHFDLPEIDMDNLDFSRMFKIKSRSRQFAFAFLHPRMMELLMDYGSIFIEIEKDTLFVAWGGRIRPQELEEQLAWMVRVRETIPDYLLTDDRSVGEWLAEMETDEQPE